MLLRMVSAISGAPGISIATRWSFSLQVAAIWRKAVVTFFTGFAFFSKPTERSIVRSPLATG